MYDIRFTELADQDLFDIYVYTHDKWGEQQALKYTDALRDAIYRLAADPYRVATVDRSYLRSGYRSYYEGHHLIFYRVKDDALEIVRILHERMDVPRHL